MLNAPTQTAAPSFAPLVAIVDDEESIRTATSGLMRSIGYRTECYASAEDFLLRPGRLEEIHCLLLDVKMDGMDGLALQEWLASAGVCIPTIFITAHCSENMCAHVLRNGAIDILEKPCGETVLLNAITQALKARRREQHQD